ncbi:hypothetical protein Micbo1qcDRAFT_174888 [Microdochium bolleyi]|uniref:Uncharacterized protein n=1 Tax=Microdochium bolleyi TaxID=196109 RepID=A0A136J3Q5_9PEZI|nr:hypothetical protein Micbo1qcDRAFT_174888 [Microdochium bolleyi]
MVPLYASCSAGRQPLFVHSTFALVMAVFNLVVTRQRSRTFRETQQPRAPPPTLPVMPSSSASRATYGACLPVPLTDPNDPLNFKTWEKAATIFCCCLFSLAHDRRPVFIGCRVVLLDRRRHAKLVHGLSRRENRARTVHRRNRVDSASHSHRAHVFSLEKQGVWLTQTLISILLNIFSSYINAALGWQWDYWAAAIAIAVGLVVSIFGAFETRYARPAIVELE